MFAVWFYELAMCAVKLLIWAVGLMCVLSIIINRNLIFIGAVEDPKWCWGYLFR